MTNTATRVQLLREGDYLAEVPVDIILDELEWSPGFTLDGVEKLEIVRAALKAGDMKTALQYAKVFEVKAISAG